MENRLITAKMDYVKYSMLKFSVLIIFIFLILHISVQNVIPSQETYQKQCVSIILERQRHCGNSKVYKNNVTCFNCNITNNNYTICKVANQKQIADMSFIIPNPESIENLIILFDNTWHGQFPLMPKPINLSGIKHFRNLRYFELTAHSGHYFQLYPLIIDPDCLKKLTHLSELAIRLPIATETSSVIVDMVRSLKRPKVIDLTHTKGTGFNNTRNIFESENMRNVKRMCLRLFQLPGNINYENRFDIFKTFSEKGMVFPEMEELDLGDNMLTNISPGVSIVFPNLLRLDVSGNFLLDTRNLAVLMEAFLHPNLQVLNYSIQGFAYDEDIPAWPDTPQNYKRKEFVSSKVENNSLKESNESAIMLPMIYECVNNVSHANISNSKNDTQFYCNFMKCIDAEIFAPLNCSNLNIATEMDGDCFLSNKVPIGKNLQVIDFSNIHFEQSEIAGHKMHPGKLCIQNSIVQEIFLTGNKYWLQALKADTFVSSMTGVIGMDNIQNFSLFDNHFTVNFSDKIGFEGQLRYVEHLDLSGNRIIAESSPNICDNLPGLRFILMDNGGINSISSNMFVNCSQLEKIVLSRNNITENSINKLNLTGVSNLKYLDLRANKIQTLERECFQKFMSYPNLKIDLSSNLLSCDCENRGFIIQLQENSNRFQNYSIYYCKHKNGKYFVKNIADISGFWNDCNNLRTIEIVLATCFSTIFVISVSAFLFKMKWRIRYSIHQIRLFLERMFHKEKHLQLWKYDSFISYCATDRFWVHSVLMRILENKYGFKLCIHYRDFALGETIVDNIVDNMSDSREIIIVLTEVATKSHWCQYELDQAICQMNKRGHSLIIIKLGTFNTAVSLNPKVIHLLEQHTYLEWTMEKKKQNLFWSTLVRRLYQDGQMAGCCCNDIDYKDLDLWPTDPEEDEQEVLENFSSLGQLHWKAAQKAKSNAEVARSYQCTLLDVLSKERLPHWAYGPLPTPIEHLLQEHLEDINYQISSFAHNKLRFLIKCLDTCIENQTEVYLSEMRKLRDTNEIEQGAGLLCCP